MNKKTLLKVIGAVVFLSLAIFGWEQIDHRIADWYDGEPVIYKKAEPSVVTVDALVNQRAEAWLNTPEALEYAKKVVTNNLLDELGKQ